MKRWLDTLFGRVFLVQAALALTVALLFGVLAMYQQSQTLARATAPIWAAALQLDMDRTTTGTRTMSVNSHLQLLDGPPPVEALDVFWFPRFRALLVELRAAGVPVQTLRVSGQTGQAVTWLKLDEGSVSRWVGLRGETEGKDARDRGSVAFLIGGLLTLLASWWLSHRVVRPLADLRLAMQRFEREGRLPAAPSSHAPVEVRELAAQFGALARQRQDLDEQRRTMLAAISHDLRSPLGRIRMAAELLPEAEGVALRRESIVRNVQVADRLLASFIDLARAEDEPIHGRVDLAALVLGVSQEEGDLTVTELPQHPVWLQPASAVALERALRNLLDNARHHGEPPFELSLRVSAGRALLSVRDHGAGIPQQQLHEMLQPFVRGEPSRQKPGTGLGLAIVQSTVLRHGGELRMSDAQPGLRIELSFPMELA